jgi:ABC-type nickel/cobalt efflux system permease component RcnA
MIPSLPKLLGLIAIIWVVWTVFRIYETRQAAIRAQQARDRDEARHDAAHRAAGRDNSDADHSVDVRECKTCGAWVSGENCGQENCPY